MKQITKTEQIKAQLRAAFGADANLDALVVYETIALNPKPIRKAGGIFKGARASLSLLGEAATSINRESVPIQMVHNTSEAPYGRAFYGEVVGDELRVLFAIDSASHPEVVSKIDSGVLDQVSVGLLSKAMKCSKCDFNYMAPNAMSNLYMLECDEGHRIGEDGTHVWLDGLDYFFELSLVGMGAANGARIVGQSDSVLQGNSHFQQRLAASALGGVAGIRLSVDTEELSTMTPDQMTRFEAAITQGATATAQLTAVTGERDAARTELAAAQARIQELTASGAAETATQLAAAQADLAAAVTALQAEATTVLTACGKPVTDLPKTVTELTALIAENRAAFAAIIPVNGATTAADSAPKTPPAPSRAAAFATA